MKPTMYEIMTSGDFENVVDYLGLENAKRTYLYTPTEDAYWADSFAVWELNESEFNILNNEFKDDDAWNGLFYGIWWRYSDGSIIENDPDFSVHDFTIHRNPVKAWANADVDHVIEDEDDDGQLVVEDYGYEYLNPFEYCIEEIDVSTPKNVDAVCTSLAKLNDMTLAEFFKKYMGGKR